MEGVRGCVCVCGGGGGLNILTGRIFVLDSTVVKTQILFSSNGGRMGKLWTAQGYKAFKFL